VKSQFISQLPWAAVFILFVGMMLKQTAVHVKRIIRVSQIITGTLCVLLLFSQRNPTTKYSVKILYSKCVINAISLQFYCLPPCYGLVCISSFVTNQNSTKMAKCRITQTMLHNIARTVVFDTKDC